MSVSNLKYSNLLEKYFKILTLFKNGGDFSIILSAFKLALLAPFVVRYSFESLTQQRG